MSSVRDGVAAFFAVFIYDVNDIDVMVVFFFRNGNDAVDFRDDSVALRLTGFKQFFDTRKTLCNIPCRRDAACVERTHRQLRARFADGLGRDSADRFADIYLAARAQIAAVAFSADAVTAVAGKDGTNPDLIVIFSDFFRLVGHDFFINRNDDFARIRIDQGFRRRTAFDSFFQRFDDAVAFDDSRNFYASDIVSDGTGRMFFTLNTPSGAFRDFHAGVPGLVYIENATAAAAMSMLHGVPVESIRKAISTFCGVVRRFDIRLNIPGHTYIDDYAHHPAELAATISSIRQIWPGRKICGIFQPHLYSRTKDFYPEFASSLSLLDSVILLPIYPAREEPIPGVSSEMILDRITLQDKRIIEKQDLLAEISNKDSDILVTFGAGDIDRFVKPIESLLKEKYA